MINGLVFPWAAERITAGSQDIGPIDLLFSYTPDQVFGMVHAYGESRTFYAIFELTIDVIYPIVYSLLFSLILTAFLSRAFSAHSVFQRCNLVPWLMGIADVFENTGIVILLLTYPAQLVVVARVTSLFTSLKWILLGLTLRGR